MALLPGEYKTHAGVITQKRLTLRSVSDRAVLIAPPRVAERKAIVVVRGGDVTVENIEFRGARSDDANGAGIRHESGRLTVRDCLFLDNENGILTGNDEAAELVVEDSEFGMAPRVEGGLHHLLYVGRIGRFSIRGSRFYSGYEGHLIKSRARESRIAYNLIYDGDEGQASYEIDLPNGGLVWLIGNVIGQGPQAQNPVMVAYASEQATWPRNGLYVSHNTFVGNPWPPSWNLRVFGDRIAAGTEVRVLNNVSLGLGLLSPGTDGEFRGQRLGPAASRAAEHLHAGLRADARLGLARRRPGRRQRRRGVARAHRRVQAAARHPAAAAAGGLVAGCDADAIQGARAVRAATRQRAACVDPPEKLLHSR